MKRVLLFVPALLCVLMVSLPPETAEAYWGYRRYRHGHHRYAYRPRFSMSLSGGLHFVDTYDADAYFPQDSYVFSYGLVELGGHLWITPNLSIDLGLGSHFVTDLAYDNASWGYVSIKPGARLRFGVFYLRGALDFAFGESDRRRPRAFLFGFLLGAGLRIPVSYRIRLIAEVDFQMLIAANFYMPFYGKLGIEVVF